MSDRLQEIRARLDAATPGPWHRVSHDICCGESWVLDERGYHVGTSFYTHDDKRYENLDLIAHAPADIAWLLDEVEAWRSHCGCCDCQRMRGGEVIGCECPRCKRYRAGGS